MVPSGTKRKAAAAPAGNSTAKKSKPVTQNKTTARGAAATKVEKKSSTMPPKKAAASKAAPKKSTAGNTTAKKAPAKKPAPKKATGAKKAAPKKENEAEKPKGAPKPKPAAKRKRTEEEAPPAAPKAKKIKIGPKINDAATQRLDIYVFGEGSAGELGLGATKVDGKSPVDVKRPRLNANLAASTVGVVQIATGGMHCVALTHDNQILTWGVNDQGALGRDTNWEGGLVDIDAEDSDSDSDDDDTGMNPKESTPTAVESKYFAEGTKFIQVAASDSATFVVTEDGSVYGWGTFRSNEGILGFNQDIEVQRVPIHMPELKKIKKVACGANHALALDAKGNVFAWGSGQQNQLGRRIVERTRAGGLVPREFGLPRGKIVDIACGGYHAFAVDNKQRVFAWGLNNYGQTGVDEGAGEDNAVVSQPTVVKNLAGYTITEISGGNSHSMASTKDGKALIWGRADTSQPGVAVEDLPADKVIMDDKGAPRIISDPVILPLNDIVSVAAGTDTSFAVTGGGQAYSWGFSANYQTGQGTDEDVKIATLLDNTAVRGKQILGARPGGQFGLLFGRADN